MGFDPIAVFAVNGFFLCIDLIFFGANSLKLFEGGWFPLLLAISVTFVMLTWRTGHRLVERAERPPPAATRGDLPPRTSGETARAPAGHSSVPDPRDNRDAGRPRPGCVLVARLHGSEASCACSG